MTKISRRTLMASVAASALLPAAALAQDAPDLSKLNDCLLYTSRCV